MRNRLIMFLFLVCLQIQLVFWYPLGVVNEGCITLALLDWMWARLVFLSLLWIT